MFAENIEIPLTVVKSDGGFTYDTSDMACIRDRINTDKAEWVVYVTDIGQSQHFKVIFCNLSYAFFVYLKRKIKMKIFIV